MTQETDMETDDSLPIGGSDNPDIADAMDLDRLRRCYGRVKPYLSQYVFKPALGWRYDINSDAAAVLISLWEGGQVGFAFGIISDAASPPFIALYCSNSREERVVQLLLRRDEREIRKRLGRAFFWKRDGLYPVGEYVLADRPEATARRLAIYRDVFTAHLDRVMPRRFR